MRTAPLGQLEVSVIGLGCNNLGRALDRRQSAEVVATALDSGVTYFDTASNYGNGQSESFLGSALGSRRDEAVIATKFGMAVPGEVNSGGAHPSYVARAVRRSLSELGTDRIDLYQLHQPDPDTPIGDTLEAMWKLVDQGLVREIGCSNLESAQLAEAMAYAQDTDGRPFISNQMEFSLLHRDPQTNGLTDVEGVALLPFYPLACGLLTGKVHRGEPITEGRLTMDRYQSFLTEENHDRVDQLRAFASERDVTMVTVALGWLLAQPEVPSVTPGATKPEQVRFNAAAADWQPTDDDLRILDEITST